MAILAEATSLASLWPLLGIGLANCSFHFLLGQR